MVTKIEKKNTNGNGAPKKGDSRQKTFVKEEQMSATVFDFYLSFVSIILQGSLNGSLDSDALIW
jgi:hypothetical protein